MGYFIKSETSDSFASHFDGHFAYLKTLDFYFKLQLLTCSKISNFSVKELWSISTNQKKVDLWGNSTGAEG